jgi:hypothetical protein
LNANALLVRIQLGRHIGASSIKSHVVMSTTELESRTPLDLRPGEIVRVRSAREISDTLDEHGMLQGVPFMPEMLEYCGRTLPVFKRADRTCDQFYESRRMENAVHLSNVRCDGSAHGGCQAACLVYWKEAWLERVAADAVSQENEPDPGAQALVTETLVAATTDGEIAPGEPKYRCQATCVKHASVPISPWDLSQYGRDVRNWGPWKVVRGLLVMAFNKLQAVNRRLLPRFTPIAGGRAYPFLSGTLEKGQTPSTTLGLQPGDLVRIKDKDDIMRTLDSANRNRGLSFDVEMVPYCGRTARVRGRVERLIEEPTGKMIQIKSDCIALEDVVCKADYRRFCTRSIYPYWREIWLEKLG